MHRATVEVYEERGSLWAARRKPVRRADARAFAERVAANRLRVDLGCGAGRYLADIGAPAVGIDAAWSMLEQCRRAEPHAPLVRGDLEALPFVRGGIAGGWANMSYLHLPGVRLPMALAELHRVLVEGAPVDIQVLSGEYEGDALPADDVGGRFFCGWTSERFYDAMTGAGFHVDSMHTEGDVVRVEATRLRTLPDFVGSNMRVLFVGLNPSLFAADAGVGFARRTNRFWSAALAAGLVTRDRDPVHALRCDRVGMTDLVKRATVSARDVSPKEYRTGLARVERLVGWLEPQVVCMVGLAGWRAAVDQRAVVGPQERPLASRPVYVVPSTSGLNAHAKLADLVEHMRAASALCQLTDGADSFSGTRA